MTRKRAAILTTLLTLLGAAAGAMMLRPSPIEAPTPLQLPPQQARPVVGDPLCVPATADGQSPDRTRDWVNDGGCRQYTRLQLEGSPQADAELWRILPGQTRLSQLSLKMRPADASKLLRRIGHQPALDGISLSNAPSALTRGISELPPELRNFPSLEGISLDWANADFPQIWKFAPQIQMVKIESDTPVKLPDQVINLSQLKLLFIKAPEPPTTLLGTVFAPLLKFANLDQQVSLPFELYDFASNRVCNWAQQQQVVLLYVGSSGLQNVGSTGLQKSCFDDSSQNNLGKL